MQGQLFTQDFLTRGVTETPPYQALTDSAFAAFRQSLQSIFRGLDGASTINEAQTEQVIIEKVTIGHPTTRARQRLARLPTMAPLSLSPWRFRPQARGHPGASLGALCFLAQPGARRYEAHK